ETAGRLSRDVERYRRLAVEAAFALVAADYSWELVGLRIDPGLGFFYGIIEDWKPLPVVREVVAIAEIAERRTRTLNLLVPTIRPPASQWVNRLRLLAAGTNEFERTRVIADLCAERRRGIAGWSKKMSAAGGPPIMEMAELSYLLETVAQVESTFA